MQRAVRDIAYAEAEAVVALGMSIPQSIGQPREGLTDTEVLSTVSQRELREVVLNQTIRDATFRYRVVEDAYEGRCALTGVRMTNGFGRAEVDAAHIRPVEDGGPDSTRNGMALMKTMHWAFDRGLISLENDGRILTVERGLDDRVLRMLPDDRQAIWPKNQVQQPHHSFLEWHRTTCFKGPVVQNAP
jgi:putative restriction endonuclease